MIVTTKLMMKSTYDNGDDDDDEDYDGDDYDDDGQQGR